MPPGRKEKDVLAKQKQLAAMLAAKRRPSQPNSKNGANSGEKGATVTTLSSASASKRPRIRGRPSKNPSSSVIDLTTNSTQPPPSGNGKERKVIMGIHKSFKRQSASSVMAAARARALKQKQGDTADGDKTEKTQKKGGEGLKSEKNSEDKDNTAKAASKKRLANLVQNAASTTLGNKDDWSLAKFTITPDDFWKNIRKWDFVTQLANLQLENRDETKDIDQYNKVVPDRFISARHYVSVWAPLCLAECRAQLLSDIITECGQLRGGRRSNAFVLVNVETTWKTGRGSRRDVIPGTEHFSDITDSCQVILKIPESEGRNNQHRELQFFPHDICCLIPVDKIDLVENLLFRGNGGGGRQASSLDRSALDDPNSDVFKHACIVGHTETRRKDVHGLILKVSKRKWAQVGSSKSGGKSGGGSNMYLLKIGCNITALREFTALSCVDSLPLKHYLLGKQIEEDSIRDSNDRSSKRRKLGKSTITSSKHGNGNPDPRHANKDSLIKMMGGVEALGKGFTEYARRKFNPSQLMAISASSQGYGEGGFTLIKGPPGTGKTTTLVNILNALHIRQFNKYYDEVRKIIAIQTGNRQTALGIARRAKPRLLVCAPSNAAVDNVILKIMEDGFIDGSGQRYNPSITRIGAGQSPAVKDVALETEVDQILTDNSDVQQLENSIAGYRMELQRITTDILKCRKRIHAITNASPWPLEKGWEIRVEEDNFDESGRVFFVNHKDHTTTYECPPPPEPGETQVLARSMPEYRAFMSRTVKLVESYFRIKSNLEQSTIVKGSMGNGAKHFEVKQNLEMHVLNSVHIVMTTLGTAGGRALTEGVDKFEVVVVDEAAQSVEPATLAAMQLGSRHCVMVGDPQQLPATIFNVSGKNSKYDRSLFQRLEEAGEQVFMLNEQYRMHPKISHFPRHIFYKGALKDGPNVRKLDYGSPLVEKITSRVQALQPFTVLDLESKEERGGTSLSNSTEADLAVHLYESLKEISNGLSAASRVAVITPYSQQASVLRRKFSNLLGENYTKFVEVNTVDAFQGREAKIVIFSAVRAAGSRGIGFLSDVRRMNVALTRAKNFLFVIARCESIRVNPYWKDLVDHAHETNAVVRVPILKKFKKGKTRFGPVREWMRTRDPPKQPLPTEGSSFKEQLKFFQNSSGSLAASSTSVHISHQPPPQPSPYTPATTPPIGFNGSVAHHHRPQPQSQCNFQNTAPPNFNNALGPSLSAPPPPHQAQPCFQTNTPPDSFNIAVNSSVLAPPPQPPQQQPYFTNNANNAPAPPPQPSQQQQPYFANNANSALAPPPQPPQQQQPYFANNANIAPVPPPQPPQQQQSYFTDNANSAPAPPPQPPQQQQPYFANSAPAPPPQQQQPYFANNANSAPVPLPQLPQQQQPYFANNAPSAPAPLPQPHQHQPYFANSAPAPPPQPLQQQPYFANNAPSAQAPQPPQQEQPYFVNNAPSAPAPPPPPPQQQQPYFANNASSAPAPPSQPPQQQHPYFTNNAPSAPAPPPRPPQPPSYIPNGAPPISPSNFVGSSIPLPPLSSNNSNNFVGHSSPPPPPPPLQPPQSQPYLPNTVGPPPQNFAQQYPVHSTGNGLPPPPPPPSQPTPFSLGTSTSHPPQPPNRSDPRRKYT